jgi:hypothetical protein
MASLASSKLRVDKLNVFNSTYRCSLGLDKLMGIETDASDMSESLQDLKSLSLSISGQVSSEAELEALWEELQALGIQKNSSYGLSRLLDLSSRLESLHLHWYHLHHPGHRDDRMNIVPSENQLFKSLSETACLPYLKTLTLRGAFVTEKTLLTILRSAEIQSFSMEETYLVDGTFRPIFDHCTSSEADMNMLFFSDLQENKFVLFEDENKTPNQSRDESDNESEESDRKKAYDSWHSHFTLQRAGAKIRQPIRYRLCSRIKSSPQAFTWRKIRLRDYGPPLNLELREELINSLY